MLEVRLLGKFDVRDGKKTIAIASRPAQSLFAYLILNAGTSFRREKLAGMLWPDSLEETARDNLRHALWRIRKALPQSSKSEYIIADDLSIAFNGSVEYQLDVSTLDKAGENASTNELASALSEYQGELLPGFYDEWAVLEREHVKSVYEHKMARLMSLLEEEKRWLEILDWGERWIKLGQKPEPAYRALMSAHASKGDMSKVAVTYERCVKSLKEFGIEPSEQTRQLYERIKTGKETREAETTVPVRERRKESPKTNLPIPLTSFIGREKEVQEVVRLLGKNRLVTLLGAGGVGKTRLAIESGNKLLPKYKDGIWWVDLVGLSDPSLVPQEVAKVLGAREMPNRPMIETLVQYLESKQLLIVLDNCEHLISACSELTGRLLSTNENLKILATSREALDILGETIMSVPSLSLPGMGESLTVKSLSKFESVRLFDERARLIQPGFELSDQNVGDVTQICKRLSGMPLAIELAAARVKMMTVEEIAKRLDDRFDLLTSGNRSALPRHQTLRATIDWSYDLLAESEQILFRRLAVFAGGFTLEAAEAVCGDEELNRSEILDLVGRLVDKSLVIAEAESEGGGTRYRLLETIREYALMKLSDAGEVTLLRDRHLEYFMRRTENVAPDFFAAAQVKWFALLETEVDNMRSAMEWSMTVDESTDKAEWRQETGLRLVGGFEWFWQRKYMRETVERTKRMLAKAGNPTLGRARALVSLGLLHWTEINFSEGHTALQEAVAISRNLDDRLILAWSLIYLGGVAGGQGNYNSAQVYLEEGLAIVSTLGSRRKHINAQGLLFLGDMHFSKGEYNRAQSHYEEAARSTQQGGDLNWYSYTARRLGYLLLHQGDTTKAKTLFSESLLLNAELAHPLGVTASLAAYAALTLAHGKESRSAQLGGAVENLLGAMSLQLFYLDQAEYNQTVTKLRSQVSPKTLEKAWAKGAAMTFEEAVEFALERK